MSWLSAGVVWYAAHSDKVNPIVAGLGGAALVWAAIQQARTATRRHYEQTRSDQQRRLTESFSKAVEQLGSDKLEVRLGGIYALERISQESPQDHWTVMETLTAFVRERTQRAEAEQPLKPLVQRTRGRAYFLWVNAGRPEGRSKELWDEAVEQEHLYGEPPAIDIAAVLTVTNRRSEAHRKLETEDKRALDFRQAILRRADFRGAPIERTDFREAHLEGADLREAHLERARLHGAHFEVADLREAHLEGARLIKARLEGADLRGAHLEGANLREAHLERARLRGTRFEGADLQKAHLERARLLETHLEGANLSGAHLERASLLGAHLEGADLEGANLARAHLEGADLRRTKGANVGAAHGDARTRLPAVIARPSHWPAPDPNAPD
jgi:uncharacterized protein YjbI with pentapeptide repeats